MQAFTDFILQVTYPPNPIRALDNSLTPAQQAGRDNFFNGAVTDTSSDCNGCHVLDPASGLLRHRRRHRRFEDETAGVQDPAPAQRVPEGRHVRHAGGPVHQRRRQRQQGRRRCAASASCTTAASTRSSASTGAERVQHSTRHASAQQLEQFMLAFDSNLAPIVGQQVTLTSTNGAASSGPRIDLLIARAAAGECDLVVKGTLAGEQRGWRAPGAAAVPDRPRERGAARPTRSCARWPHAPGRSSPTPACRRAPGSASASTATRTASSTATSSTPAATRPIRRASRAVPRRRAPPDDHDRSGPPRTTTTTAGRRSRPDPDDVAQAEGRPRSPSSASFSFKSSNKHDPAANRIVAAAPGSPGDPTLDGGAAAPSTTPPASPSTRTPTRLAAAGWTLLGSADQPEGVTLPRQGRSATPSIKSVTIKADSISVKGIGIYTLDEPAQGRVAVASHARERDVVRGRTGEDGHAAPQRQERRRRQVHGAVEDAAAGGLPADALR